MPIGARFVSTLHSRFILVVILMIMAWGEYQTNSQLNNFHQSYLSARDAEYTETLKNHALLLHIRSQLAHVARDRRLRIEAKGTS